MNKAYFRAQLRAKRYALTQAERLQHATAAAKLFLASTYFQNHQRFACYLARDDEFDTAPLMQQIWQANKQCLLPVLSSKQDNSLEFVLYNEHDTLQLNRYQILEPVNRLVLPANQLDVVLMPLVGFDAEGNRLGMGGGYYDKTFEFLLKTSATTPILIGVAHDAQSVDQLPSDVWDVPLDAVLTEQQLLIF